MYDEISVLGLRVTNFCNLNCKYCYQHEYVKNETTKFTDYKALNKFLIKLPLAPRVSFMLSGGEPSLSVDELRNACKQINKVRRYKDTKFCYNVFTNGSKLKELIGLMDEGYIEPYFFHLSWDGLHSASRSRLVKNKAYDDEFFNKNIKYLGTLCNEYREGINIRTAATRDTIDELFDDYRFVVENGCKHWEYYVINDEKVFEEDDFISKTEEQLRKIFLYAREHKIAEYIINIENMLYMCYNDIKMDFQSRRRWVTCRHLGTTLFFNPQGEIFPCSLSDDISKVHDEDTNFGNIYEGLDKTKMENFVADYNKPPSCGMMYKGKPCHALHCFECMVTCKHCAGSLESKLRNQCELRHMEMRLFKEIFLDTGYKFDSTVLNQFESIRFNELDYNPVLNSNLPFKENKTNDNT